MRSASKAHVLTANGVRVAGWFTEAVTGEATKYRRKTSPQVKGESSTYSEASMKSKLKIENHIYTMLGVRLR